MQYFEGEFYFYYDFYPKYNSNILRVKDFTSNAFLTFTDISPVIYSDITISFIPTED